MFKPFKFSSCFVLLSVLFLFFTSCEKEEDLQYSEINISHKEATKVVITIPKVVGKSDVAKKINGVLEQFVIAALQTDVNENTTTNLNTSVTNFNNAYKKFNSQVEQITFEPLPAWEAIIEGEKIYEDESLVAFSMSSNINTGAAKSITKISFLNFDKNTGKHLLFQHLISDGTRFNAVLETYLVRELMSNSKYTIKAFKTEGKLRNPDELSFNDNGIIALYLTNLNDFIEIAVPFSKVEGFLNY